MVLIMLNMLSVLIMLTLNASQITRTHSLAVRHIAPGALAF